MLPTDWSKGTSWTSDSTQVKLQFAGLKGKYRASAWIRKQPIKVTANTQESVSAKAKITSVNSSESGTCEAAISIRAFITCQSLTSSRPGCPPGPPRKSGKGDPEKPSVPVPFRTSHNGTVHATQGQESPFTPSHHLKPAQACIVGLPHLPQF